MNIVNKIFSGIYNRCEVEVPFDPKWNNGTGYYDHLVKENFLKPRGTILKCLDPETKRRILIVTTRFGNVVVFDRFSQIGNSWDDQGVFVSNVPRSATIYELIPPGAMGERSMVVALGGRRNIGQLLEEFSLEFKS